MKVITENPVVINNKKVNRPSMYLSANGGDDEDFYDIDGKNKSQVKAFQDWMDATHPNWVNGKNLNKGPGYGTYGPSTTKAYANYGAEYDALKSNTSTQTQTTQTQSSNTQQAGSTQSTQSSDPNLSATDPKGQKKKGHFWNKAKGAWEAAKQGGGIFDTLKNKISDTVDSLKGGGSQSSVNTTPSSSNSPSSQKTGMSTGAKVAIGVGVAAILGFIIYKVVKSKKNKK